MKKSDRIPLFLNTLKVASDPGVSPFYAGYFACFNARQYYEAHDVLEHLWLECRDANRSFYQGLIQIAGAFVHLRKQFMWPEHPKDGQRLRPAVRLFHLGIRNLEPYGPKHLHLDVADLCARCGAIAAEIQARGFTFNPWQPLHAMQLHLELPEAPTMS